LRAIGQDLERIPLPDFDMKLMEGRCVVNGMAIPPEPEKPKEPDNVGISGFFKKILSSEFEAVQVPEPQPEPVEKTYRLEDVERLEMEGQAQRSNQGGRPDPYRISQMLRVSGAYFDGKNAQVVGLLKRGNLLKVDYRTESGELRKEDRQYAELYDFGLRLFSDRQN